MRYRDILGLVLASDADESVIAATGALADQGDGHATALLVEIEPDPVHLSEPALMGDVWTEMVANAHKAFQQEEAKLQARLRREARARTVRTLAAMSGTLGDRVAVEARHADIAVISSPVDVARRAMFEGLLFGSGRPLMVVPPNWKSGALGRNVVIGWNAKREAARALADARPLLAHAEKVTILTVDATPNTFGHGEAPGADVAAHLARCGLRVEVRNTDGLGRSGSEALIEESRALKADLLVIGGYGHACRKWSSAASPATSCARRRCRSCFSTETDQAAGLTQDEALSRLESSTASWRRGVSP